MYSDKIFILALAFLGILLLNLYMRVKVLKYYRMLTKDRVDFSIKQMMSEKLLKEEVLPKYPKHKETILKFSRNVKRSMAYASIILMLIIYLGITLIRNS